MKIPRRAILFLFSLLLLPAAKDACAQWTRVPAENFEAIDTFIYKRSVPDTIKIIHGNDTSITIKYNDTMFVWDTISGNGQGVLAVSAGVIWGGQDGLWFSEDTGKSWHRAGLKLGIGSVIHDINFYDRLNGVVATSSFGVLLTRDGGKTWKQILLGDGTDFWKASFNGSPQTIHASGTLSGACFTSRDGGNTWHQSTLGPAVSCMAIASDHTVYVLAQETYLNSGRGWVNVSTDYGTTWTRKNGLVDGDSYTLAVDSCNPRKLYLVNEDYASTNDGISSIFISTNAGDSWTSTEEHPVNYFTGALAMTKNSLYASRTASSDRGILRSTDKGISWQSINGPILVPDARTIGAVDDNILFAIDGEGQLWMTLNSGANYLKEFSPDATLSFQSKRVINDSSNITIHLPIYFHHSGPVSDVDMIMHYPYGSLKLLDTKLYNGKSFDVASQSWNGRVSLHFNGIDLASIPDSLLGYANFHWTPFESDCRFIDFDSIRIADPCSASEIFSFRGIIGASANCNGALGVNETTGNENGLFTFSPNPAGNYGTLSSVKYSGTLTIRIYDNIGRLMDDRSGRISPNTAMNISLTAIPNGMYFIRIISESGVDDLKISVEK
jgi:photosystem II stability/assembly factor-like uncharacterized protein